MSEPLFTILDTDLVFADSPDAGEPECLCSRCRQPITALEVAVRAWPDDPQDRLGMEYRYHPGCLGMQGGEPEEDDA